jgi:putative hydrolase of HD superfamily
MITKNQHTEELLPNKIHPIIDLFFKFAQLKNLYRQGWLKRGVSKLDCETVAEHSFGVALLGYVIASEQTSLDTNHVMKLGLFHDIGEIYAGDITPQDGISIEDKKQKEYAGVQKVFSRFPNPENYISLWQEFENQTSPEAKFVKEVDRLEMALQAYLYERMNYKGLDELFPYIQQRTTSQELNSVLNELLKSR